MDAVYVTSNHISEAWMLFSFVDNISPLKIKKAVNVHMISYYL